MKGDDTVTKPHPQTMVNETQFTNGQNWLSVPVLNYKYTGYGRHIVKSVFSVVV